MFLKFEFPLFNCPSCYDMLSSDPDRHDFYIRGQPAT